MPSIPRGCCFALAVLILSAAVAPAQQKIDLRPCSDRGTRTEMLCGTLSVYEDRDAQAGRQIALHIVVLPATGPDKQPDPVFVLAGGPGQAATTLVGSYARSWMREERDIVLVDQRGTGKSNPLPVPLPGGDDDLQAYLDPLFSLEVFRAALRDLEKVADLTCYTTPIAMDDLDDVRTGLGYDKINLFGGSYGTRAALVYLRRHPEPVRTMVLNGIAPPAFTNPLYHAREAQTAFELLAAECSGDPRCREAYGDLRAKLDQILARLDEKPARVAVRHPQTGRRAEVTLTRDAFASALRVLLYSTAGNRRVPGLLQRAWDGDYAPFAEAGIRTNRGLRQSLSLGMLMSVVGSEDIPRIDRDEIERATAGTFVGASRVWRQIAVADIWPRGKVPAGYGEPVREAAPVLLLSGTQDPVTGPRWGAHAAKYLPNGLHLVIPGAHGVGGACVQRITQQLLRTGSTDGLDTECTNSLRMPPIQ